MRRFAIVIAIAIPIMTGCTDSDADDASVGSDAAAPEDAIDTTADAPTAFDASPDACDPLASDSCGDELGCYVVVTDDGAFDGFACLPAGTSTFDCDTINDCAAGWQCFDAIGGGPHNDEPDGCKELCRAGVDPCSGECRSLCDAEISCDPALDEIGVCLFIGG